MPSYGENGLVLYECVDGVATITLNRPDKLNAFNDEMVVRLAEVLREFDIDDDAHVAIMCGAGRAFSSGADVRQRQLRPQEEFRKLRGPGAWGVPHTTELFSKTVNWKPIIAAPHGYAIGMGLGITLESELVVAAEGTQFQVTEATRGLPASRYWALLSSRGGASFAVEAALTGRFFTAEEAFAWGLINRVVPREEQMEVARELAATIAANPPLGIRATVRTRRWYREQANREAYLQTDPLKLHLSEDFAESAQAFADKRKPNPYKGK